MEISRQEIRERVEKVFREVFENPSLTVSEQTTAADIPSWDSLAHINLIIALEQEFNIQFMSMEVTSMTCVGDLFVLLEKKKGGSDGRL